MTIPETVRSSLSTSNPPPADSPEATLRERDWLVDIRRGNEKMAQGRLAAAEQAYLRSIVRANTLLDLAHQELNNAQLATIYLYAISCTNLGNLYQQWQRWNRAEAILHQGHQRTIEILNAVALPVAFRWEAMLALREIMVQMLLFYRDLEQPDRVQPLLAQTQIHIQNFLNSLEETQT